MRTSLLSRLLVQALFVAGIIGFVRLSSSAQQTPEPSGLVFRKNVRRVILDVVVTGTQREPVHGLTKKDFSVKEDRKSQKILSFDVHDLDSAFVPPSLPHLPPNTFVNVPSAPERGPLYVLLLDLRNTEHDDQPFARQQLTKFLRDKPSGTRFAIFVLSDELRMVQGFTEDKNQLLAAVDPRRPKSHIPMIFLYGNNYGRGDTLSMIGVLNHLAQYLDGLPGRKNLIWFSGGFPLQMFPGPDDPPDLREELKKVVDTLVQARVAVYTIDVRGVVVGRRYTPRAAAGLQYADYREEWQNGNSSGAASVQPSYHLELAQYQGIGGSPMRSNPGPIPNSLFFSYTSQDEIAQATGGRAFYSDNDLKDALLDATENGGNYYTLTYSPSNKNYDGKLRNIHVELSTKGYELAYRRSYYADDPDSPVLHGKITKVELAQQSAPRKLGDSLYANMQHGAPMAHQIYFRAHFQVIGTPALATPEQMANLADQPAYFRARRKNKPAKPLPPVRLQTYAIDYTLATQERPKGPRHEGRPPAVEIAAAAFNDDGQMLNGLVETSAPEDTPADRKSNPAGIYRVEQQFEVPLAATSIRVAVRDVSTDRIGALEVPLPLPPETQVPSNGTPTSDSHKSSGQPSSSTKPR